MLKNKSIGIVKVKAKYRGYYFRNLYLDKVENKDISFCSFFLCFFIFVLIFKNNEKK